MTSEKQLSAKPGLHEGNQHQNIISRANERGIPILLVNMDIFKTAKTIDDMEALLKKDDTEKIQLLSRLIEQHLRVEDFLN